MVVGPWGDVRVVAGRGEVRRPLPRPCGGRRGAAGRAFGAMGDPPSAPAWTRGRGRRRGSARAYRMPLVWATSRTALPRWLGTDTVDLLPPWMPVLWSWPRWSRGVPRKPSTRTLTWGTWPACGRPFPPLSSGDSTSTRSSQSGGTAPPLLRLLEGASTVRVAASSLARLPLVSAD